jgi:hypothetical protein
MRSARIEVDTKVKAQLLSLTRTWTALAVQTERLEQMLKEREHRGLV